jgi:hypothetical protein
MLLEVLGCLAMKRRAIIKRLFGTAVIPSGVLP